MKIEIVERLRPYTHLPGQNSLIPGTTWQAKVFPTKIDFLDLSDSSGVFKSLLLNVKGPLKDFTVQLDLEKALLRVWGESPEGFLRYRIEGGVLTLEKAPSDQLECTWEGKVSCLKLKDSLKLFEAKTLSLTAGEGERLSLGCHRAQDWDLVKRRMDLHQMLPICLRLSEFLPELPVKGSLSLLETLSDLIEQHQAEAIEGAIESLMKGAFEGLSFPRLKDTEYQGLDMKVSEDLTRLSLLKMAAKQLRRMFLTVEGNQLSILPHLPKSFHCGRFLELSCGSLGTLNIEWSKKCIRRLCFQSSHDGSVNFVFRGAVKTYRLKTSRKDRGVTMNCHDPLRCVSGKEYFLDNFQK